MEEGVTTLALTDHDGIDGVAEAAEAAADAGIALVPATEISCVHGSLDDMHMLGYWVDTKTIAPAMERAQRERITRAEEIVERLNAQGVPVRFEDAIAQAGDASSVGRPHIAKAAGVTPDGMSAFFEEWLVPGAKAFVPRRWPACSRGHRDHPRSRGSGRPGPPLLGHEGPRSGCGDRRRPRPGGGRVLLPGARPRPDEVPRRALHGTGAWRPPPPRTFTAPPTRCSTPSAPTRRTTWASRSCPPRPDAA